MMDFDPRLYVEIVPLESEHPPRPHPLRDARFRKDLAYKVLGIYNPSETSECYLMLANPDREIWFIPQRHVRAWRLIESPEFFVPKSSKRNGTANGHHAARRGEVSPSRKRSARSNER